MERFLFTNDNMEQDKLEKDSKAVAAFMLMRGIVADPDANSIPLAMISFEIDSPGVSATDICQYYYDNFTENQIAALYAMSIHEGPKAEMRKFDSEEELQAIKAELGDGFK